MDVTRDLAHNFLLPTQKAAYASPFDLDYYAKKKEVIYFSIFKIGFCRIYDIVDFFKYKKIYFLSLM